MTRCVRTQGVGVPARINASPANTSAVVEPVWIPVIFTTGELCVSMHIFALSSQRAPFIILLGDYTVLSDKCVGSLIDCGRLRL